MSSYSKSLKQYYSKCKTHGTQEAQVMLSDYNLYVLLILVANDLELSSYKFREDVSLPSQNYYELPLSFFINNASQIEITIEEIYDCIISFSAENEDFQLYFSNLTALHRRRVKFFNILKNQKFPTVDQVGPRILLEFGSGDIEIVSNWLRWRKWFYDLDNRSAQETGYLFEPIVNSSLGGQSVAAQNSPVKRINANGDVTDNGRQIDCYVDDEKTAYELKLRVTIAASGQGRWGEELSFPAECKKAGIKPVLLVLDPTPSHRLTDLQQAYITNDGAAYLGDDAWAFMEKAAGDTMGIFVNKYIRPPIENIEDMDFSFPNEISFNALDVNNIEVIQGSHKLILR
jgi:hypothetical protein